MHRRFEGGPLVIASHNPVKVREIADLLAPHGAQAVAARDLGLAEPLEAGDTFRANAETKARAAAQAAGLPALADDSGLSVDAIGGEPGIRSARWAGPDRNFDRAMRRLEDALAGTADRRARFVCVLALCWPDAHCETFEGCVCGSLVWPPRGDMGFGYDPVFVPAGGDATFGEMDAEQKHAISHRAVAVRQLLTACFVG